MERKESLVTVVKGFFMGLSHAVPGVSGGTLALILGIYGRLVDAVSMIGYSFLKDFLSTLLELDFEGLIELLDEADVLFLVLLSIGVGCSLVASVLLLDALLVEMPVLTYGFFTGLIGVSGLVMLRDIDVSGVYRKLSLASGFIVAFGFSGVAVASPGTGLPVIFVSGFLSVGAFIIPGISGAVVLVMLGQYDFIVSEADSFFRSFFTFTGLEGFSTLLVFGLGGLAGLLAFARSMDWLLDEYSFLAVPFLVGLVIGSLRAPLLEIQEEAVMNGLSLTGLMPELALSVVLGGICILLLDHFTDTIEY